MDQVRQAMIMGLIFIFALVSFCSISCAAFPAQTADDPIVGQWDGVGYLSTYHAVFGKDQTYRLTDSWLSGKEEVFASGKWTRKGEKYALPYQAKEGDRTATIDAQNQLIVTADINPEIKLVFRRRGAEPAVVAAKPPEGEWRYAYTSKSTIPAASPFPFDVLTFAEQGKVRLKSSSMSKEFNLNYQLSGNVISVITGEAAMPKLEFSYRWEDGGKKLVLAMPQMQHGPFELEWTYLRPDQFLPCEIKGTWCGRVPAPGMSEEIQMGPDGRWSRTVLTKDGKTFHKNNTKVSDYYRLWKAPFGNALTVVTFDAEMSAQLTQIFKIEKKENEITATPVELQQDGKLKLHPEATFIWKLKRVP